MSEREYDVEAIRISLPDTTRWFDSLILRIEDGRIVDAWSAEDRDLRLRIQMPPHGAQSPDPWDACLDVDPFTGQPDHIHGDACCDKECCE